MPNLFEQIQKSALKFLEPLSSQETYETIVKEAIRLVNAKYGAIVIQKDKKLLPVYFNSPPSYQVIPRQRGYCYKAYKTGRPLVINRKQMDEAHPQDKDRYTDINSVIFIPLSSKGNALGVLTLQAKEYNYFNKEKVRVLKLFGSLASLAIRKTQIYEDSQKALKTRDLFISIASHELKSPLTTIRTYAQLLNVKKNMPVNPKWAEALDRESRRLSRLLNELLTVDQIKTGQFKYVWSECDLREVCLRAVVEFQFNHPDYTINFHETLPKRNSVFIGDSDKLLEVLTNLLNNAAKYSKADSPVNMSLQQKNNVFIIKVRDRGIGIPKKELPNIFSRFYQGEHKNGGMGLGLFVVDSIVNEHNGSIKVTSKPGFGSTFTIFLPTQETINVKGTGSQLS